MAACRTCGYAILGAQTRCPKCGAWLSSQAPSIAPSDALAQAVGVAARPPPQAPARSRPVLRHLRAVAIAIVLLAVIFAAFYLAHAERDRAAFPLNENTTWTFKAQNRPETYMFRVDGATRFKDTDCVAVDVERERGDKAEDVGQGYLVNRLFGLDVVGVTSGGTQHTANMRLLPYPTSLGRTWTSYLGESWTDRWRADCRIADGLESVTLTSTHAGGLSGTYDTVHVTAEIRVMNAAPLATIDYWLAPDLGPVRIMIDQHGLGDPPQLNLDLVEYHPGTPAMGILPTAPARRVGKGA